MVSAPKRAQVSERRGPASKRISDAILAAAQQNAAQTSQRASERRENTVTSVARVQKYLDDYRSPADIKALRDEGYEIDYDRLVGVGLHSAVFLAHSIDAPSPPLDANGQKPLYTPGYDIAVKVVAKKWIDEKKPSKVRTGNLKLALALGQTKPENNILKVIDVFKTPERVFIFMQYCSFGNIISFIRRNGQVPSRLARRWSMQIATALSFLHKFHVAHRNYKLENVLIDENLNAKLTGFGLSKFCVDLQTKQTIMSKTICGSEPYLAPEMLKESAARLYDPKQADVWAFGVGVFLCVTRRYPFEAESLRALKAEQLKRRYLERDTKKRLRAPVRELLSRTFILNPTQRPTMQELIDQCSWLGAPVENQRQLRISSAQTVSPAGAHAARGPGPRTPVSPAIDIRQSSASTSSSAVNKRSPVARRSSARLTKTPKPPGPPMSSHQSEEPSVEARSLSPIVPRTFKAKEVLPSAAPTNIASSTKDDKKKT